MKKGRKTDFNFKETFLAEVDRPGNVNGVVVEFLLKSTKNPKIGVLVSASKDSAYYKEFLELTKRYVADPINFK